MPWSLAGRRLPKFYLVSFWIDDPGKRPILGFVNLVEHIAAFFLQGLDQGVDVFHSVVDHKESRARSKLITFLRSDEPGSCACNRLALGVGPIEGSSAPDLDIDSQVPLVPGPQ